MDPITQGVVGATAAQLNSKPNELVRASLCGWFAGMAADLDILIRSNTDPLLALEYHRQFTHSLIFIPFGALLCAVVFHALLVRGQFAFARTYVFCFLAYATHALLDACTTYGTLLFWPFSLMRVAWNTISVVDPVFTIPAIVLILFALVRKKRVFSVCAALYMLAYLALGLVQNHRAEQVAVDLALSRGHSADHIGVKPSFANIVLWKSVYEYQNHYYVDAVRVGRSSSVIEGSSVEKLNLAAHFPWLKSHTQQARDIERFRWFSNQHLGLDAHDPNRVVDIRYSLLPNQTTGMWGIVLNPKANDEAHVEYTTNRPQPQEAAQNIAALWAMVTGDKKRM